MGENRSLVAVWLPQLQSRNTFCSSLIRCVLLFQYRNLREAQWPRRLYAHRFYCQLLEHFLAGSAVDADCGKCEEAMR